MQKDADVVDECDGHYRIVGGECEDREEGKEMVHKEIQRRSQLVVEEVQRVYVLKTCLSRSH